jgi:alginate O-acetyltransferase complex protein AlgI
MVAYPTMLTMLLTGIWHGAGLQFLIFGLIHGVYLTANQAWRHFRQRIHNAPAPPNPTGLKRLALMVAVYLQVTFALIFFRSESFPAAIALLRDMFGAHGLGSFGNLLDGSLAFALFPVVWFLPNTQQILGQEANAPARIETPIILRDPAPTVLPWLRWRPSLGWAVAMAILFFAVLVELNPEATFLYFQF